MRALFVQILQKLAVEVDKTVNGEELDVVSNEMMRILRRRRKFFEQQASMEFAVGDEVEFVGKHGRVLRGTLTKKGERTAKVTVPETMVDGKVVGYPQKWTVSWPLLRRVARKEERARLLEVVR